MQALCENNCNSPETPSSASTCAIREEAFGSFRAVGQAEEPPEHLVWN